MCDEEGKCVISSVEWRVLWRVFEGEFVMKSDEAGQVISFKGKILVQYRYQ